MLEGIDFLRRKEATGSETTGNAVLGGRRRLGLGHTEGQRAVRLRMAILSRRLYCPDDCGHGARDHLVTLASASRQLRRNGRVGVMLVQRSITDSVRNRGVRWKLKRPNVRAASAEEFNKLAMSHLVGEQVQVETSGNVSNYRR